MFKKGIFILFLGAGLTACSSFSPKTWNSNTVIINEEKGEVEFLEAQIKPYRDSLAESMNQVIGFADENLVKGRPCSPLNNWAADAILIDQDSLAKYLRPNMSLLNFGSIRSTINAGEITVGDIFTIMPFDNLVVWVKMPLSSLPEIAAYLNKSGGEPISNATLTTKGLFLNVDHTNKDHFWIVTSDYLMNGGDYMSFFEKKLEVIYTDKLLRESFMDQVKAQGTLKVDKKCRINVE
jgi:2',3'-cyclic-nucleotide 2'-phosphodiesterase (5'-nucleotidase family)|tara:strand:+ start:13714 stop:14424 length:711 start_codon:yes stop_codon:yes gene_type:complete